MDGEQIRQRLVGFGMKPLVGVDPNADNFCGAGILHTRALQIGCLLRIEPNRQAKMYRLTIRSSRAESAKYLCEMLSSMF